MRIKTHPNSKARRKSKEITTHQWGVPPTLNGGRVVGRGTLPKNMFGEKNKKNIAGLRPAKIPDNSTDSGIDYDRRPIPESIMNEACLRVAYPLLLLIPWGGGTKAGPGKKPDFFLK